MIIHHGDNLNFMSSLPNGSIDLIYIDPPYFSQRNFGDFDDRWDNISSYLDFLILRFEQMSRLLKESASIYVHCDWHASHYIKVELDKILGYENFLNEIIVHYIGVGLKGKSNKFHQNTDSILSYAKNRGKHTWNDFLVSTKPRKSSKHKFDSATRKASRIRNAEGKIEYFEVSTRKADNFIEVLPVRGNDIYPTQKEEIILEQIILASSNPNDIVADFFVGGGSSMAVAKRLGRCYIGCDTSEKAIKLTIERLSRI